MRERREEKGREVEKGEKRREGSEREERRERERGREGREEIEQRRIIVPFDSNLCRSNSSDQNFTIYKACQIHFN